MPRKHIVKIVLLTQIFLLLLLFGCTESKPERTHLLIVTTIYPYELIVRELAPEDAEVVSIVPSSASPHTYSPKPEDIKLIEDADLIVSNGAELEAYLDKIFINHADKHIDAFTLIRDILYFEERSSPRQNISNGNSNHHHHINPHFWLDPLLVIEIVEGISEVMIALSPDNRESILERKEHLEQRLHNLNFEIIVSREEFDNVSVLNLHDAFYYFNNRYDIHSTGVIVKSPGKEPTAAELVSIGKKINEYDTKIIFTEPQFDPKPAEIIGQEFGLQVATLDPLGNEAIAQTITDLIKYNWNVMKNSFLQ